MGFLEEGGNAGEFEVGGFAAVDEEDGLMWRGGGVGLVWIFLRGREACVC
jgi:hypothetical protein